MNENQDPNKDPNKDPNSPRNWLIGFVGVAALYLLFQIAGPSAPSMNPLLGSSVATYDEALKAVQSDDSVNAVVFGYDTFGNPVVTIEFKGKTSITAGTPPTACKSSIMNLPLGFKSPSIGVLSLIF